MTRAPKVEPDFLRVRDICERTHVSKGTVMNAIRRGDLIAVKLGGVLLVRVDDYRSWIATARPVRSGEALA